MAMERKHAPGKWGGAAGIEEQVAPMAEEAERVESENKGVEALVVEEVTVPANIEKFISPETHVYNVSANTDIVDLYKVGHETVTCKLCEDKETEISFAHQIKIHGLQGKIIQLSALFNGTAMVAAMSTSLFKLVKH